MQTSAQPTSTVDPAAMVAQICATPKNCAGNQAAFKTKLTQAIASRMLFDYTPQKSCSGAASLSVTGKIATIGGAGAGTAAGIIAAAGVTGPFAPIVAGVGIVLSLIGGLSKHHAQAVATQDALLCLNVPQTNAALQAADQGLASGSITPAQAAQAYQTLQQQFHAAMISDPSYKKGDALWLYDQIVLPAVIQARMADIQAGVLTGGAPAPWSTAEGQAAAALGLSPTMLWLLLGGAAVLFLS